MTEYKKITALNLARIKVLEENPDLPMQLKFDVSPRETIERLLKVIDLTELAEGDERNIVGRVYDSIVANLEENNFQNIKIVRGSPIVPARDNFDKLLFSPGNPGRSSTYTRYVDEENVLRTHTSALIPSTLESLDKSKIGQITFVLPGLVYRRDVIDPRHLDVFHQVDVWTLQDINSHGRVDQKDLIKLVKTIFDIACPGANMLVLKAEHPYTVNGVEIYAEVGGKKIEILEAGLIHPGVLENSGLDPQKYCGLASGMGLERLIMARKNLPDIRLIRSTDPRIIIQMSDMEHFKSVSDKPPISRDMSYCVGSNDSEEDICEAIRNAFGDQSDLLEEVKVLERTPYDKLSQTARQRLGAQSDQDNVLVRITLRHPDKTLTKKEAANLYSLAYPKIHKGEASGYEL